MDSSSTIDLSDLPNRPEWTAIARQGNDVLVDRACIDLIKRKREGQVVTADDYIATFPQLDNQSCLLDLIDADICVSVELGQASPQEDYSSRHPELAAAIGELVRLDDFRSDDFRSDDLFLPSIVDVSTHGLRSESNRTVGGEAQTPFAMPNSKTQLSVSDADESFDAAFSVSQLDLPPDEKAGAAKTSGNASAEFSVDSLPSKSPAVSGSARASKHQKKISDQVRIALADQQNGQDPNAIHPLAEQSLVDTPDWFVPRQCVAVGPGHWLIRGRDDVRDTPLALKVVRLPPGVAAGLAGQLLDACEAASKVRNKAWVNPVVATVQNQHLGTIRPWWFARAMPRDWSDGSANETGEMKDSIDERSEQAVRSKQNLFSGLATIAFAVAAAHKAGATHGGISAANILVDHEGGWKLVDAVSNRQGLSRYLSAQFKTSDQQLASLESRMRIDIQDLIKTVSGVVLSSEDNVAENLIPAMRSAGTELENAAADIGSLLMDVADSKPVIVKRSSSPHPVVRSVLNQFRRWIPGRPPE